jgi:magnesium chelatase family protein
VRADRVAAHAPPTGRARWRRRVVQGTARLIRHLTELIDVLTGEAPWPDHQPYAAPPDGTTALDLSEVHGQPLGRLALEIAAAGGHHTMFIGPPGSGKTMLAARLPGLLPPLDRRRALEATMVHSAAGVSLPSAGLVERPPFRAPHHTSSMVALVGGGSHSMRPGEVSLAHCGVLFLDEIAEFPASVLDSLRQPLEEGVVRIARAAMHAVMPAEFLLVAAMNPCPCGGGGSPGDCVCIDGALHRYARRLSGPLIDRFDLRVNVHRPGIDELIANEPGEASSVVAGRVAAAPLDAGARRVLRTEMERQRLSGRGYHRVRRVARTIADLRGEAHGFVSEPDVVLALELRSGLRRTLNVGRAA